MHGFRKWNPNSQQFVIWINVNNSDNKHEKCHIVRIEGQVVLDVLKFLAFHRTKLGIAQGLRQILLIL